jgi:pimeloyl-ACP methyl ester carboxylesterase
MTIAKLEDVDIYYKIKGEGKPLLMITGYSGNSDGWDNLIPRSEPLSKHFKVIIFDNRGTGRSSSPEGPYSIKTMANDAAKLLDYLSIEKAHILGSSMGGAIAQEVAINHPEKVDKLVLFCTTPGGELRQDPMQKEATEKLSWMFSPPKGKTQNDVLNDLLEIVYYPDYLREHRDRIISSVSKYPTVPATLEKQYVALWEHDTSDRLSSIEAPTLVIHGEDDLLLFPNGGRLIAKNIPDAKLLMYEKAGHSVFEEKWDTIYPELVEFLGEE